MYYGGRDFSVLCGSCSPGQKTRVLFTLMSVCTHRGAPLNLNHQAFSIFGFATSDTSNKISFYMDDILLNDTKPSICIAARSILKTLRSCVQGH